MLFNDRYEQKEIKGQGRYGTVFKVFDKKNNQFYALKFIMNENEDLKKEIEIIKNIKNKYIIELKANFYDEKNKGYCIVMDLCDGNLKEILKNYKKGLPLNIVKKIFIQLNEALKTIINKGFIHRDLKPENILIKYSDTNKNNFDIKLADFGLSNEIKSSIHSYSIAGTSKYMAPEVETYHYNNKCDLWSLGIILYELYTNEYIFDSDENRKKGKIIKETDNEMINKLIRKLIQVNIDERIEWEKYFNDDFFKIKEEKEKDKEEETELNGNLLVK